MSTSDGPSPGTLEVRTPAAASPIRVFINYRREDTQGDAMALYHQLAARYGRENVFLDVVTMEPGTRWLEATRAHGAACAAFIALIGPRWSSIMSERGHARVGGSAEDYVRLEIETAFKRGSGATVIPVIIDDAVPPSADALPRSLAPLAETQMALLRHSRWDDDVEPLFERIDEVALTQPQPDPAPAPPLPERPQAGAGRARNPIAPEPDQNHYDEVLSHMIEWGTVVPILGPRVNGGDRKDAWAEGCGQPPNAEELAADLARRFTITAAAAEDLARVSQYVYVTSGKPDLYRTLGQILGTGGQPSCVHRFFANLPAKLEALGRPKRYQLIVTTNYDNALEQAFDDAGEPYDRAVYMASGEHRGKFLHVPWDREPRPIVSPNDYFEFPIGDDYEVARTVIVKIHGAVDNARGPYPWKGNFVITEDQYIDYLSGGPVEQFVPMPILDKVRESHCLFLGYTMRDWNLRVFLKRIWGGQPLASKSWAVGRGADVLERESWRDFDVDLFDASLAGYVSQLDSQLTKRAETPAGP